MTKKSIDCELVTHAKSLGIEVVTCERLGKDGISRVFIKGKRALVVTTMEKDKEPRPMTLKAIKAINESGGAAFWNDDPESVKDCLDILNEVVIDENFYDFMHRTTNPENGEFLDYVSGALLAWLRIEPKSRESSIPETKEVVEESLV